MKMVRCTNNAGAEQMLELNHVYDVAIHVTGGTDYRGRNVRDAYVLAGRVFTEGFVPRCWASDRFVDLTEAEGIEEIARRRAEMNQAAAEMAIEVANEAGIQTND